MNPAGGFTSNGRVPSNASTSSVTAGIKRKRDSKASSRFYAVRVGRSPGIYHSWAECLDQVRGFPKAIFKSFTSLADADGFCSDGGARTVGTGKEAKWYGVLVGRRPGVYDSWPDALSQITGCRNATHKAFKTKAEAEQYVANGVDVPTGAVSDNAAISNAPTAKRPKTAKAARKSTHDETSPAPAIDLADFDPGDAPLPEEAEDGFDSSILLDPATGSARYKTAEERAQLKAQAVRPTSHGAISIYTDGSSLGNGQDGAVGGVGVYFGPGDRRNLSEGLAGSRQTNQRAELTALLRALELAPRDRRVVIYTDSNYAINCVTLWFQRWRANNWHNAAGKPVENKDLVIKILDLLEDRYRMNRHRVVVDDDDGDDVRHDVGHWEKGPASVKFVWVKGHDKNQGNNAADQLAVNAAKEAKAMNQSR